MTDSEEGIALGRYYDEATQHVGAKITYTGERHLLLFGPNGTGKGTRFLIPNLLSIKDRSIICYGSKRRAVQRHNGISPHARRCRDAEPV